MDQWAHFREGSVLPASEALRVWRVERQDTLKFLRSLRADVMTRQCNHSKWGRLTFEELLNEFAFHDMGHLRQILELCRARAFYPHMGAWRQYYQVSS